MTRNPTSTSNNQVIQDFPKLDIPDALLKKWHATIQEFCRTRGKKKIESTKDFLGYLDFSSDDIVRMWSIFTSQRKSISHYLKNADRQCAAYLLGFHLPNLARTLILNKRIQLTSPWKVKHKKVEIIDLGCGTGAVSGAFTYLNQEALTGCEITIHLVDKQRKMAQCAASFLSKISPEARIKTWFKDIGAFLSEYQNIESETHYVLILGNVLNEAPTLLKKLSPFLNKIAKAQSYSNVMIVDPAQEGHSRHAMQFAEDLRESGLHTVYPCQNALHCPMLELRRDWCFLEGFWNEPREQKMVDRLIGVEHLKLNLTGFWFSSSPEDIERRDVIVGRPIQKNAGRSSLQYILCSGNHLHHHKVPPGKALVRGAFFKTT